jgi:xanthine/uracil permease
MQNKFQPQERKNQQMYRKINVKKVFHPVIINQVILSLGCSVISVAFSYFYGYFSLLMPNWL